MDEETRQLKMLYAVVHSVLFYANVMMMVLNLTTELVKMRRLC